MKHTQDIAIPQSQVSPQLYLLCNKTLGRNLGWGYIAKKKFIYLPMLNIPQYDFHTWPCM